MIVSISANQPTFKKVVFQAGLNIVMAERTKFSTEKDSRNGVGKSTLLEIINFCLGGDPKKGKKIYVDDLADWTFKLELKLLGQNITASRNIGEPKQIIIEGDTRDWKIKPVLDTKTGLFSFSNDQWKAFLGSSMFALHTLDEEYKYKPTFRSLISYMLRRGNDAYSDAFRHYRVQAPWDIQVNNAFLLGLAWQPISEIQTIREKEDSIKAIEQAIKSGLYKGSAFTAGELEAEKIKLELKVSQQAFQLKDFKVHPQYKELEINADSWTKKIHLMTDENISDNHRLRLYEESIENEKAPASDLIQSFYQELGLIFTNSAKATLDQAKEFHAKVIENRKNFLSTEIGRLKSKMLSRDAEISALSNKRAEAMEILQSSGTLDEYTKLQKGLNELSDKLMGIERQIKEIRDIAKTKNSLKTERLEVERKAQVAYEDRRMNWEPAIKYFNENSQALYNAPGKFVIDVSDKGYAFNVEIERSGSDGIEKMKVFCYDVTIAQLLSLKDQHPGFLCHDSIVFDGVDSRQRALAIQRIAAVSIKHDFQYICTLNSDMIPYQDFTDDFDIQEFVRLNLTDRNIEGSLLGLSF